jgi:hypothetical protein
MDKPSRHGDVVIYKISASEAAKLKADNKAKKMDREGGRLVLAHGEVTGHAHAVAEPTAMMFDLGDSKLLELPKASFVTHEEHKQIALEEGSYRVYQKRQYKPNGWEVVRD